MQAFLNILKQGNPALGSRIKHVLQKISYQLVKQTDIATEGGEDSCLLSAMGAIRVRIKGETTPVMKKMLNN